MEREFLEQRTALAKDAQVSVDDIPAWRVKTTLQRAVQVLKLHRNSFFAADADNRPPSCVVTTLAGMAYDGESSLTGALLALADAMPHFIERDGDVWVLENPAQKGDNLADRWSEQPEALGRFVPWLEDLQRTLDEARHIRTGMQSVVDTLATRFDRSLVEKSMQHHAADQARRRDAEGLFVTGSGALTATARGAAVRPHTFHGA
jgi:hypothetical protein